MIKTARIKFDKLMGETSKACLLKIHNKEHWVPKSLCENFTLNKKLGGNVILPVFIINRIFDTDINESEEYHHFIKPVKTYIHHKPKKLDSSTIEHDATLTRKSKK